MSEVRQKMDQEAVEKKAAEKDKQQWNEVVEDIWRKHLPHFRAAVNVGYGDFIFDAATGRYGFQYESSSEGEDDLMGKDEEEVNGDNGECSVPENDQPSSTMPSHTSSKDKCECSLLTDRSILRNAGITEPKMRETSAVHMQGMMSCNINEMHNL